MQVLGKQGPRSQRFGGMNFLHRFELICQVPLFKHHICRCVISLQPYTQILHRASYCPVASMMWIEVWCCRDSRSLALELHIRVCTCRGLGHKYLACFLHIGIFWRSQSSSVSDNKITSLCERRNLGLYSQWYFWKSPISLSNVSVLVRGKRTDNSFVPPSFPAEKKHLLHGIYFSLYFFTFLNLPLSRDLSGVHSSFLFFVLATTLCCGEAEREWLA